MTAFLYEVQDAGKGISAEKLSGIQSQGSGVGIRGMRERVRQFQGEMNIESNQAGTRIFFRLPVPRNATTKQNDAWQDKDTAPERRHAEG